MNERKASSKTGQAHLLKSSLTGAFITVFDGVSLDICDLLIQFKSKYIKTYMG